MFATAHAFGWRVAHFRPALTKHGWRTAVSADGKGFPDLVLTQAEGGTVFRELKRDATKLDADQEAWGKALTDSGADWAVWRPRDWPEVLAFLSGGRVPAPGGSSARLRGAERP